MKATELRIGNYYQYAGNNGIIYTQVKEIKHNQFGLLGDFDGTNYEICKPIQLTKEWLIKFGFDNTYNDLNWYIKGNYCFSFLKELDLIVFKIKFQTVGICTIKYVHEVQNIYFALTGEELSL
tara:strand:+ start:350 stop:718 length:369 start_codon:yes stop_codon:yes gene_type:complete